MRWTTLITAVVALVGLGTALADRAWAQETVQPPQKEPFWLPDFHPEGSWCRYPAGQSLKNDNRAARAAPQLQHVTEVEPNDSFAQAQLLEIGPKPAEGVDIDVAGTIAPGADVDLYRFWATKGDIIGLAVLGELPLDPIVAIQQVNGVSLVENDDDAGLTSMYPPESPFPRGRWYTFDEHFNLIIYYDSALTWVAPADGQYLIRVTSYFSSSNGTYTLKIRARRGSFEEQDVPQQQILFLDFDGVTGLNARALFGAGYASADLSPLRAFLVDWGLEPKDEPAVVEAIITKAKEIFDGLRRASLNGNRDVDFTNGHFDVQILNSRDDPDPFGQPNASRVIIGGTIWELGIFTIGIAESIDPGNFAHEETAVVLLDLLSVPANDPWAANSVNSIGLAPGLTRIDAIGAAVGNVAVHEAGHILGNWHTDNDDDVPCIMDQGGVPIYIFAGAGPDGILGTGDDQDWEFIADAYIPNERVAVGDERTDVNTAFALSTGRLLSTPPDTPQEPQLPLASMRATPTTGTAPLTVDFAAGAVDNNLQLVSFTWDFGDGSAAASGSTTVHVYATPGAYTAKLTAVGTDGTKGEATQQIAVTGQAPTAVIVATPTSGAAPLVVTFEATNSSDSDGSIVSYNWDFGDGTMGTGTVIAHVYGTPNTYVVSLTVTDNVGQQDIARLLITVSSASVAGFEPAAQEQTSAAPAATAPLCGVSLPAATAFATIGLLALTFIRRR